MKKAHAQLKPVPRKGRRSAGEARQTLERMLDAAQSCFAELGYSETSNKLIAEKAGINPSNIYNHFTSKADIYAAVCKRAETKQIDIMEVAIKENVHALDVLMAIIDAGFKQYQENPSLQNFISKIAMEAMHNQELMTPVAEAMSNKIQEKIIEIITQGQKLGEIDNLLPAEMISQTFIAALMGITQSGCRNGEKVYKETIDVFKAVLKGSLFNSYHGKRVAKS